MIIIKKEQLEPINELIKTFSGTHKFCNNDLNKFILSLRKAVYPYEYMDKERFGIDLIWEIFGKTSLPDKNIFCNDLYLEDVTNKDYTHAQKVFKEFKFKNLGDYGDLYVQSGTLLLAEVFENL